MLENFALFPPNSTKELYVHWSILTQSWSVGWRIWPHFFSFCFFLSRVPPKNKEHFFLKKWILQLCKFTTLYQPMQGGALGYGCKISLIGQMRHIPPFHVCTHQRVDRPGWPDQVALGNILIPKIWELWAKNDKNDKIVSCKQSGLECGFFLCQNYFPARIKISQNPNDQNHPKSPKFAKMCKIWHIFGKFATKKHLGSLVKHKRNSCNLFCPWCEWKERGKLRKNQGNCGKDYKKNTESAGNCGNCTVFRKIERKLRMPIPPSAHLSPGPALCQPFGKGLSLKDSPFIPNPANNRTFFIDVNVRGGDSFNKAPQKNTPRVIPPSQELLNDVALFPFYLWMNVCKITFSGFFENHILANMFEIDVILRDKKLPN